MAGAEDHETPEERAWFERMVVRCDDNPLVATGLTADGRAMAARRSGSGTRGAWLAAYLESGLGGDLARVDAALEALDAVAAGDRAEAVSGQNDVYVVIGPEGVDLHHDTLEELDGRPPQRLTLAEMRAALVDWRRALAARPAG